MISLGQLRLTNKAKNVLSDINLSQHFDSDHLNQYSSVELDRYEISDQRTLNLLSEIGLPFGAAPEFQFFKNFEVYNADFLIIGDGYDFNKILLDKSTGEIFEELKNNQLRFVNSHLEQHVRCLCQYAKMVDLALVENGDDVYLSNNIPEHFINQFMQSVTQIDESATQPETFWGREIRRLYSRRIEEWCTSDCLYLAKLFTEGVYDPDLRKSTMESTFANHADFVWYCWICHHDDSNFIVIGRS